MGKDDLHSAQGQVTLVPPVNQGRTRKVRRRRNPDAAPGPSASTTSLATSLVEVGARPTSAGGPSRVDSEPQLRRPRRGTDSRAVSSPDVHTSEPYPDYPPPSFEEVLALDRSAAPPNVSARPVGGEQTPQAERPASPPPASPIAPSAPALLPPSESPNNPTSSATATPWEEDRLLGMSLEQRVQRELERNLKHKHGRAASPSRPSPTISIPPPLPVDTPSTSSPSTSIAASNFLTPQNLTPSPSPSRIPLQLTASRSPRAAPVERDDAPPAVPPKSPVVSPPVITPGVGTGASGPSRTDVIAPPDPSVSRPPSVVAKSRVVTNEPPTAKLLGRPARVVPSPNPARDEQEPILAAPRPVSQESPAPSGIPLSSLLFTTKLNLNGPIDSESPQTSEPVGTGRASPRRGSEADSDGKGKVKDAGRSSPERPSPVVQSSPRKVFSRLESLERPSSPTRSRTPIVDTPPPTSTPSVPFRPSVPPRPLSLRFPPPAPAPPLTRPHPESTLVPALAPVLAKPAAESSPPPTPSTSSTKPNIEPLRTAPEPPRSSALRRPPPPPPPARRVGSAIAARISAYEAILANAPKVPPPVPPRPRAWQAKRDTSGAGSGEAGPSDARSSDAVGARGREGMGVGEGSVPEERLKEREVIQEVGRAKVESTREPERPKHKQHENASPTRESERPSRPRTTSSYSREPQSQPEPGPSRIKGRALPGPPRIPSPERTRPAAEAPEKALAQAQAQALLQAQALVPARIGPDGKFEIIPDAEVIWLDETKEKENAVERRSASREAAEPEQRRDVFAESAAGPSCDPFLDDAPILATSTTSLALPSPIQHIVPATPRPAPPPIAQRPAPPPIQQLNPQSIVVSPPVPLGPTPLAVEVNTPPVSSPSRLADDFEYTDLDLLISRLEENETARQGANYEVSPA